MNMIENERDELLTTDEAAKVLDVKPGTLEVWRAAGRYQLPYVKVGRNIRYRRRDLLAFLEKRTVTPTPA